SVGAIQNLVEVELVQRALSDEQLPRADGVEASTHESEFSHNISLQARKSPSQKRKRRAIHERSKSLKTAAIQHGKPHGDRNCPEPEQIPPAEPMKHPSIKMPGANG